MISRPKGQTVSGWHAGRRCNLVVPTQSSQALGTAGQVLQGPGEGSKLGCAWVTEQRAWPAKDTSQGQTRHSRATRLALGHSPGWRNHSSTAKPEGKGSTHVWRSPAARAIPLLQTHIPFLHWLSFFRTLRNSNRSSLPLSWQYYISKLPPAFLGHFRRLWYIYFCIKTMDFHFQSTSS